MEMEQETGLGSGLGAKMWMKLDQARPVTGHSGARLDWGWIGWGRAWMTNL